MKEKRIVFLGTPDFAACILEGLLQASYQIVAVISQPDKAIGRKKILTPTPVKVVAQKYNIPIYQPIKLKLDYQFLIDLQPDLLITAAYGQILPQAVLDIAKINNINVHGSLLPKYRGGAPIQRCIMNGDTKTGITIIQMVYKMDAGVMYAKKEITIKDGTNTTQLFNELKIVGRDLLLEVLPNILENKLKGIPQKDEEVTFAFNIKREEEKIEFTDTCKHVVDKIRGLSETPGAYCLFKDKQFKIYEAKIDSLGASSSLCGSLSIKGKNQLLVRCEDGFVELLSIQLEGKNKVSAKDFLNGINKEEIVKEFLK